MLQHVGRSLQREIDGFFEALGYSSHLLPLTKGALSKARSFLNPMVFKWLNQESVELFYAQAKVSRWKGFVVKAIDGSTTLLPECHSSVKAVYPSHGFGPKADAERSMARLSQLYDVFNGVVCDAEMAPYTTNEITLAKRHIRTCGKGDLLLFDRYYAGFPLFIMMLGRGIDFCVRMKTSWIEVRKLLASKEKDCIVEFELPKMYHSYARKLTLRLIKLKDQEGTIRVFCTSLTDTQQFSRRSISNLYRFRWRVEEAYKTLKQRLNLDQFSGVTATAVQQDYYGKMLLMTLCRILTFKVKPALKPGRKRKTKLKRLRPVKINYTYALSRMKKMLVSLLDQTHIRKWVETFKSRIQYVFEYTNEGHSNPRNFRKETCRVNYKNL